MTHKSDIKHLNNTTNTQIYQFYPMYADNAAIQLCLPVDCFQKQYGQMDKKIAIF